MSRFTFNLATPKDDSQLRKLLAATPMEGAVSVAFAREPSYFEAAAVDGTIVQVGVVREGNTDRIIGMGSRSISMKYVNGERMAVGYLSGLRLLDEFRGRAGLLARGYRFLRELHTDQRAPFYLTTIASDNRTAMSVLASGRGGLPIYHSHGCFYTLVMSTSRASHSPLARNGTIEIREAEASDRDVILEFLREYGASRQFFPNYETHDVFSTGGLLNGLSPSDILLAHRGDQIVGTMASWNQRRFKQIIIRGYAGWLRRARPLYNAWASVRRRPKLPPAGSALAVNLAAIPVVRDDDATIFRQLLLTMLARLRNRGERLLLVGLHEADPLLAVARPFAGREYIAKLYIVYWPSEQPDIGQLVQRVPYLELGAL